MQEEIPTALSPSLVLPFACPYFFFSLHKFFLHFFSFIKAFRHLPGAEQHCVQGL